MNDNIDSFNESCWYDFDYSSLLNDIPPVDLHWNSELKTQWFSKLCSILEPGRPVKTDKLAILGDAIRVLNEQKSESQEYKEMNKMLLEEIKMLKVEKNEPCEEKLQLLT